MTKRTIDYRPPDLVTAILNLVLDDDDAGHSIPERELLELLSSGDWKPDTVRRTLGELYVFGALQLFVPIRGDDSGSRMVRLSTLGRAWVDQRVEPYVRNVDDADEDDTDLDLD